MISRETITEEIRQFVADNDSPARRWRTPIVGFADAAHPGFRALKEIVHPEHDLPEDVLAGARVVIAYSAAQQADPAWRQKQPASRLSP